jgi:glycosyltransferase involved in cell wall biosynthesis
MKVLWITNIKFPAVCEKLGENKIVTGGWMYSLSSELGKVPNIKLAVATVYNGNELKIIEIDNIIYYLLPTKKDYFYYDKKLEKYWLRVKENFNPEIVHIHGTETPYGKQYIKACGCSGVVVSIQGLVSVYTRYFYAGLSYREILGNISIRDIIKRDSIIQQRAKFYKNGEVEKYVIKTCSNVIGRTEWDKNHVKCINPSVNYFHCNETLRSAFYQNKWEYEKCDKHTIFLSQALYPIKGLHNVLEALKYVVKKYPDTKLVISGNNIFSKKTLKEKLFLTGYGNLILKIINRNNLMNHIEFTGALNEYQMVEQFQKANLFLCPSSIENSPNSLGEAQLLGVPVIASYVGGVPDMVKEGETGFCYRFEVIEMLAELICKVFEMKDLKTLSEKEIDTAKRRHNSEDITSEIISIYNKICDNNSKNAK